MPKYLAALANDLAKSDKILFYKKLFTDVLSVNMKNKTNLSKIVNKCLAGETGEIGSLRRAKSILILNQD
jgi:hypothetical protein